MPPVKASPEELNNLIAYLARLYRRQTRDACSESDRQPGGIDFARIVEVPSWRLADL